MNGSGITTSNGITSVSSGWQVADTGDSNGDGKADLLLQNSTTGLIWMFQMNGSGIIASNRVTGVSLDWRVVDN